MTIRLLHTADLHLDRPLLYLGDQRKTRRQELLGTVTKLVDLALALSVDAVLICGDLFDGTRADSAPWVRIEFERLAIQDIYVLIVPGNHDPLPACQAYTYGWPDNVHVFQAGGWSTFDRIPGVTFYGLPFQAQNQGERVLQGFKRAECPGWHVGLLHGQVQLASIQAEDYQPVTAEDIAGCGLDYLALGHYHRFLDCTRGSTRAYYPGSPHRLDFTPGISPQVLLVTLDATTSIQVEPVPLPDRPFLTWEFNVAQPENIYRQLRLSQDPRACARLKLVGQTEASVASLVADLREKFQSAYFSLVIEDQTQMAITDGDSASTIIGVFKRRIEERLAKCSDEAERRRLQLAYYYGLAALRGEKLP